MAVAAPIQFTKNPEAEQNALQVFLQRNPGVNIQGNPQDRLRAEEFINMQTRGMRQPVNREDFGITELEQQVQSRDPLSFLKELSRVTEREQPSTVERATVESKFSNIRDPELRRRLVNRSLDTRNASIGNLQDRALGLFQGQTQNLLNQLAGRQQEFSAALDLAQRLEAQRQEREAQAAQLAAIAAAAGGGRRGGGGGGTAGGFGSGDINLEDLAGGVTAEEVMTESSGAVDSGPGIFEDVMSGLGQMSGGELLGRLALGASPVGFSAIAKPVAEAIRTPERTQAIKEFFTSPVAGKRQRVFTPQEEELLSVAESNLDF